MCFMTQRSLNKYLKNAIAKIKLKIIKLNLEFKLIRFKH